MRKSAVVRVTSTSQAVAVGTRVAVTALTVRYGTTALASGVLKSGGSGGTEVWGLSSVAVTAAGDKTESVTFPHPLEMDGVHVTVTGTGTVVYVAYAPL